MENIETLNNKTKNEDVEKKLPTFSYSKLDLFDQCNYKYKLQYIDKNFSKESTLVLDLGTIAHKGMELKGRYLIENKPIDYDFIKKSVLEGIEEKTEKESKFLKGVNELKGKYIQDYYSKCNKTGMNYDEKLEVYFNSLIEKDFLADGWKVLAVEQPFNFVYNDRCILKGFIDRIDINLNGDLRVVDYKTSKAIYDSKKMATPLQMVVYALACQSMYGKLPIEFKYDFIFINQEQLACTKGYLKRGEKKLNKILDAVEECLKTEEYVPKPTALCHWCSFCKTNINAPKDFHLCEYYSLWTPKNKTFRKNKEYISKDQQENNETKTINPFGGNNINPFACANPFSQTKPINNPFVIKKDIKNPFTKQ